MLRPTVFMCGLAIASWSNAATIRVPQDHQTIQAAINAAEAGDTVLVAPGRYRERIRLRRGVTLRSVGDDTRGELGLARAEATVLDGNGNGDGGAGDDQAGHVPGVIMAERSTLDGFTITRVGDFDQATWQQHFESRGEQLGDDEGSVQAEGTVPAVSIRQVNCTVSNNIVHHNGDVGIAAIADHDQPITPLILGNVCYRNLGGGIGIARHANGVIRQNTCFENLRAGVGCRDASPLIVANTCYGNIRAGIGCREAARPIVRGNQCYLNRRAGIGIRMPGTAPVVENNTCFQNEMAGIGSRDGAVPILRNNDCHQNKMAGIGCDGSKPLIVGNTCRENALAGIGLRGQATATIKNNQCLENKLVAIGVTQGSKATIIENRLVRTAGVPPIVAVKDDSTALLAGNTIEGGGVAALLVQGSASVSDNQFLAINERQGKAIWIWSGSTATVAGNTIVGYQTALNATDATVVMTTNTIRDCQGTAILVKNSPTPAHVFGNTIFSDKINGSPVQVEGPAGVVADNVVEPQPTDKDSSQASDELPHAGKVEVP